MEKRILLFFSSIILTTINIDAQTIKACYSCDGFGQNTTGGRGGDVYTVTNLNDSGPGSLRYGAKRLDGASESTPRTIQFDIGGDIFLTSSQLGLYTGSSNLTIAGETAPSPGITIRGDNLTTGNSYGGTVDISASNVIIRYITIRENNNNATDNDALRLRRDSGMSNIMIDHVTVSNGSDENMGFRGVTNMTVQYSMIGNSDTAYNYLHSLNNFNNSFLYNFFHHTDYRNGLMGYGLNGETFEWINNITFGFTTGAMDVVYGHNADVLGNIYRSWNDYTFGGRAVNWTANAFNNPSGVETDGSFFFEDILYKNPSQFTYTEIQPADLAVMASGRVITNSLVSSWETTISGIEDKVFNSYNGVGNSIHRDVMDATSIADYINGSNQVDRTNLVPNKTASSRLASEDSDNDDMLDSWEVTVFGSIAVTNNYHAYTDTGYAVLDLYPNGEKIRMVPTLEYAEITGSSTPTPPPTGLKRNFFNKKKGFF